MEQSFVKTISVICPICKERKNVNIPFNITENGKELSTISLQKGLVCSHIFQIFVDKQFKIRGYQNVDFEVPLKKNQGWRPKFISERKNENVSNNKKINNNFRKYSLSNQNINSFNNQKGTQQKDFNYLNKPILNLEKIYEDFWEYIDDDNEIFQKFINKDLRRG
jgi:hypothetical protein